MHAQDDSSNFRIICRSIVVGMEGLIIGPISRGDNFVNGNTFSKGYRQSSATKWMGFEPVSVNTGRSQGMGKPSSDSLLSNRLESLPGDEQLHRALIIRVSVLHCFIDILLNVHRNINPACALQPNELQRPKGCSKTPPSIFSWLDSFIGWYLNIWFHMHEVRVS